MSFIKQNSQDTNSTLNLNLPPKSESKLNYALFERIKERDKYTFQIFLTIYFYSVLKLKKIKKDIDFVIKEYFSPINEMIFPLIFLQAKYYIKISNYQKALDLLNKAIKLYVNYRDDLKNKKNDVYNIITIETYHQKFKYFDNLFNFLFCLNRLEVKIKKLYFEIKSYYYGINLYSEGFEISSKLYENYPDELLIQFEYAKDCLMFGKMEKFKKIFDKMINISENETNQEKKNIYNNFILYIKCIHNMFSGKSIERSRKKLDEILANDNNNDLIRNNYILLKLFRNKTSEVLEVLEELVKLDKSNGGNTLISKNQKFMENNFSKSEKKQNK